MTTIETAATERDARVRQLIADAERKRQEIALAPRQVFAQLLAAFAAAGVAAGALISAGIAIGRLLL
jgi:F0F1-type ATP synthase membrane subunit b/b'